MPKRTCSVDGCDSQVFVKKHQLCQSHYNKLNYYGYIPDPKSPACKQCGKETPPKKARGPRPDYCSKACRLAAGRPAQRMREAARRVEARAERAPRMCSWCGEPLPLEAHGTSKYHDECRRQRKNARSRDNARAACSQGDCSRPVRARGMCSMHWKRWYRSEGTAKPEPWDDRRRDNHHRRRARLKGARNADKVLLADLIVRDDSTCQLCGEPIDLTLEWPNPMYRSIDHRIPISRGGEHSLENTQLAHLRCNISKADKVVEEAS